MQELSVFNEDGTQSLLRAQQQLLGLVLVTPVSVFLPTASVTYAQVQHYRALRGSVQYATKQQPTHLHTQWCSVNTTRALSAPTCLC